MGVLLLFCLLLLSILGFHLRQIARLVRWLQQQGLQAGSLRTAFGQDDGEGLDAAEPVPAPVPDPAP